MPPEAQDIEARLRRMSTLLRGMRRVVVALARYDDLNSLLAAACDGLVDACGYEAAWAFHLGGAGTWQLAACRADEQRQAALERCLADGLPACAVTAERSSCKLTALTGAPLCGQCPVMSDGRQQSIYLRRIMTSTGREVILAIDDRQGMSRGEEESDLLREIADDIGQAIDGLIMRQRQERDREILQQRLEVERCIVTVSKALTVSDMPDFQTVLAALANGLRVDRALLCTIDFEAETIIAREEWCVPSLSKRPEVWQRVPIAAVPWWLEQLREASPVVIRSPDDLPEQAVGERVIQETLDLQAAVAYPLLRFDGSLFGFVGLFQLRPRLWSRADLDAVQVVCEMLAGVEERLRSHDAMLSKAADLDQVNRMMQEQQTQLLQMQKMEAVGQLAAGIAHEINTPIQFIGDNVRFLKEAFTDVLAYDEQLHHLIAQPQRTIGEVLTFVADAREQADLDYLHEEIPRAVAQTIEGVERVATIVKAMKDFAHPGDGEKSPADINTAIESTLVVSRNEYKYVAELETTLDPDLPLVPCQLGAIKQVVLNLIVNAAHAIADRVGDSGERGLITVATASRGSTARISISDNGCGIPEAIRERIFEPFFTTKEVGRGSGQGLALMHQVVVQGHNGRIELESTVGQGSTFTIVLPVDATDDIRRQQPSPVSEEEGEG